MPFGNPSIEVAFGRTSFPSTEEMLLGTANKSLLGCTKVFVMSVVLSNVLPISSPSTKKLNALDWVFEPVAIQPRNPLTDIGFCVKCHSHLLLDLALFPRTYEWAGTTFAVWL